MSGELICGTCRHSRPATEDHLRQYLEYTVPIEQSRWGDLIRQPLTVGDLVCTFMEGRPLPMPYNCDGGIYGCHFLRMSNDNGRLSFEQMMSGIEEPCDVCGVLTPLSEVIAGYLNDDGSRHQLCRACCEELGIEINEAD